MENGYLSKECENCPFWDSKCTMISQNLDCVYKCSFWKEFQKNFNGNTERDVKAIRL